MLCGLMLRNEFNTPKWLFANLIWKSLLYCRHLGKVTSDFEGLCLEGLWRLIFFFCLLFLSFFIHLWNISKAEKTESPSSWYRVPFLEWLEGETIQSEMHVKQNSILKKATAQNNGYLHLDPCILFTHFYTFNSTSLRCSQGKWQTQPSCCLSILCGTVDRQVAAGTALVLCWLLAA